MIASLVLRIGLAAIIVALAAVAGLRTYAPDRLASVSPVLVPVRHQVSGLLTSIGRDQEAGSLKASTMARGRDLARTHPLDPLPYTLVQIEGNAQGDRDTANRAALTALSFQPRNRAARMHVVNQLVAGGAYDEALDQITLLSRIDKDGQETYHTAILRLVQNTAAWPALERAVAGDPPWKERVLAVLAQSNIDTGFLRRLFVAWPERIDILLDRFVRDGDLDTAYLTFLTSLPPEAPITIPFDPSFQAVPGARPFNWRISSRYAELGAEGGLDVSYFGRGRPTLAEQVFPLAPGQYQLDASFEGSFDPEAAQLAFRIRCVLGDDKGEKLADWTLEPGDVSSGLVRTQFTHSDPDCGYIRLEFRALPGVYPRTTRLTLAGLTLTAIAPDGS
ncbi:MAG: hypothetical protein AAF253_10495 [Pseudomonadota bacterium]